MAASLHIQYWAHSVPLALAAYSYTRFRLPGCWRWHLTAVRGGKWQRSESNLVASCHSFPIRLAHCLWSFSMWGTRR
jgi:hypothetical protein